jgi:hypothetical protein
MWGGAHDVFHRQQRITGIAHGSAALYPPAGDLAGPEIALLPGFEDRQWMCWRPGEESFEDLARTMNFDTG